MGLAEACVYSERIAQCRVLVICLSSRSCLFRDEYQIARALGNLGVHTSLKHRLCRRRSRRGLFDLAHGRERLVGKHALDDDLMGRSGQKAWVWLVVMEENKQHA